MSAWPVRIAYGTTSLVHAAHQSGNGRTWLTACGMHWFVDNPQIEVLDRDVECRKCRRELDRLDREEAGR